MLTSFHCRACRAGVLALGVFTLGGLAMGSQRLFAQQKLDPAKVVGREECGKCHKQELEAWKRSHHSEDSKEPRNAWGLLSADKQKVDTYRTAIGENNAMAFGSACVACHGTPRMKAGAQEVAHGNSCESCHGAAGGSGGWLKLHYDFGLGTKEEMAALLADRGKETPEHREKRLNKCTDAGMNSSEKVLNIAANCVSCHLVPNERLVNAGHPVSSKFEFVEWANGEVRHNFLAEPTANAEVSTVWLTRGSGRDAAGRKGLMLVAGHLARLEVALRARADANTDGKYVKDLADIIEDTAGELEEIQKDLKKSAAKPDLAEVINLVTEGKLDKKSNMSKWSAGDRKVYVQHAEAIRQAAEAFLAAHADASQLKMLDVPKRTKGKPYTGG